MRSQLAEHLALLGRALAKGSGSAAQGGAAASHATAGGARAAAASCMGAAVCSPSGGGAAAATTALRRLAGGSCSGSSSAALGGRRAFGVSTGGQPLPRSGSRLGSMKGVGDAAGRAAAEAEGGQAIAGSLGKSFWQARQDAFNAIPGVPKLLGFAGIIPFLVLTPGVASSLGFPELVDDVAAGQVAYGALIVAFLGAVHWGIAMTSTLSGARAALAQRERYIWSVFPSLAVWPALMMEPAPGSLCIAFLLGICYMSDRAYASTGSLPPWYLTLRGYLTVTATLSMLATSTYFLARDVARAKARMAEADARRAEEDARMLSPSCSAGAVTTPAAARAAARAARAPVLASEAVAVAAETDKPRKRGWW
ncbi:hypothetical protein FOA52_012944 [Chlamydomonas sp. UWO 241]|nr:hypothetical protein FOA52_012944 [Chlamydomonas sp. UWO 241]